MADNSNGKKKTLIVSMLVFLVFGGGVFLFFVIQGSNDLTGAGKSSFRYGEAAREGVSSFFKSVGIIPDEERALTVAGEVRLKAKGIVLGEPREAPADISDWMTPASRGSSGSASSRGNTAVPRMSGGASSGLGGGGGGSKSSGGMSRFGEGSDTGNTSVSAKAASGPGGAGGKGTLAALTNARALLGDGLRSGSASTAKAKWDSSFGAGRSGKGSEMAYAKSGLVNLDKIKKGEVDSLKTTDPKSLKVVEPGAFKADTDAESKDPVLQKAKQDAAEAAAKAAKEAIAKSLVDSVGNAAAGAAAKPGGGGTSGTSGNPESPDGMELPPDVLDGVKSSFCKDQPCSDKDGTVTDTSATVFKLGNGQYEITFKGTFTPPGGTPGPSEQVWRMDNKGTLLEQLR